MHNTAPPIRLLISLLLLCLVFTFGTIGYSHFEGMSAFDAFYMTLITISTVGFSEITPLSPAGRIMTVIIIILGIGLLTFTLGQIATILLEGKLQELLGRKKLKKQISSIHDHFIICGYGRIGKTIVTELRQHNTPVLVIENNPDRLEELEKAGILYLGNDATEEESLIDAGIMRARGLVTAVCSDADNVFIALTARDLHEKIFILARASKLSNESKLLRAGANKVISPYVIGGKRMAEILERPTVVDFLDQAMMGNELGLRMEEARIDEKSNLAEKTLIEARLRQDFNIIVVAIKRCSGIMIFNPSADETMHPGDCIVCIGKTSDIERLNNIL